jgi:hypothetical protein
VNKRPKFDAALRPSSRSRDPAVSRVARPYSTKPLVEKAISGATLSTRSSFHAPTAVHAEYTPTIICPSYLVPSLSVGAYPTVVYEVRVLGRWRIMGLTLAVMLSLNPSLVIVAGRSRLCHLAKR